MLHLYRLGGIDLSIEMLLL